MTILLQNRQLPWEIIDFKTNLSSRPERSVVEGPAVDASFSVGPNREPDLKLAKLSR
jgi:hypothetical protein